MKDEIKDRLSFLLEQVKEAASRSRSVIATLNLVCGFILLSLASSHFSWLKGINEEEYKQIESSINHLKVETKDYKDFKGKIFDQLDIVSAPIIGLKVSVYDFSFLGSISTLILITWLSFSSKRERHIVSIIKKEFDSIDIAEKDTLINIYLKTSQIFIFITDLSRNPNAGSGKSSGSRTARGLRMVIIYYFPLITVCSILFFDLLSICLNYQSRFYNVLYDRWLELFIKLIIESITIILNLKIINQIRRNEQCTMTDIMEMKKITQYFY